VSKQKSRPKGDDQPSEENKPVSIKIETKQCERCFAETFQGQLECDVCGLILEGAGKADRTKIAERRKTALHKLGLYYDFKGEYLQSITQHQLESLGLLGRSRFAQTCQEQARESFEPYLGMTLLQKGSRKMQLLQGVSSTKVRMNMAAHAMIFCGQHIFRNRTGPKHRSGWEYLNSRSWNTML